MANSQGRQAALERAIAIAGSQSAFARALGKKQPYVPKWLKSATGLPAEYCPAVERMTRGEVRCEELNDSVDWQFVRRTGLLGSLDRIIQALVDDGLDADRVSACLSRFAELEREKMWGSTP